MTKATTHATTTQQQNNSSAILIATVFDSNMVNPITLATTALCESAVAPNSYEIMTLASALAPPLGRTLIPVREENKNDDDRKKNRPSERGCQKDKPTRGLGRMQTT